MAFRKDFTQFHTDGQKTPKQRVVRPVLAALLAVLLVLSGAVPALVLSAKAAPAFGQTWEFDTPEQGKVPGKNPFTPRGYLVDTGRGQQWLSSGYENDGEVIKYTGRTNGVDWLEAKKGLKLYAMTDRNPTPGKTYLAAWKDGKRISGFGDLAGTPGRGEAVDPSGNGTCWVIPLEGFQFEPGCVYEFGFLQGMMANNGITLVLSEDGKGYIQFTNNHDGTWNWDQDKGRYQKYQYEEYQFLDHWEKNVDKQSGEKSFFNFHFVPMRFSVQTYADLSIWNEAAVQARTFLDSVTETDYSRGTYVRANVDNLRSILEDLQGVADNEVKRQLQNVSDQSQRNMADTLLEALHIAQTQRAQASDLTALLEKIDEARDLYEKTRDKTGTEEGQYSRAEVTALADEIGRAQRLDLYTPQADVDAEVRALDEQILRVKASQVRPAVRTFYDKATGIIVIAPPQAFPADATMQVRRIDTKAAVYQAMVKRLAKTERQRILYDIAFLSGGNRIEPSEEIQVQIPIPQEMAGDTVSLFQVSADGDLSPVAAAQSSGIKVFKTSQVDLYALTAHGQTEEEKLQEKRDRLTGGKNGGSSKRGKRGTGGKSGGAAGQAASGEGQGAGGESSDADSQPSDGTKEHISVILNMQKEIQKKEDQQKQRELARALKNKEEFKPPQPVKASHDPGGALLDQTVTRQGNPKAVVYGALAVALIALASGVRNLPLMGRMAGSISAGAAALRRRAAGGLRRRKKK